MLLKVRDCTFAFDSYLTWRMGCALVERIKIVNGSEKGDIVVELKQ